MGMPCAPCCSGGPGGGGVIILGCACTSIPSPVTVTFTGSSLYTCYACSYLGASTLTWQPSPIAVPNISVSVGDMLFLSESLDFTYYGPGFTYNYYLGLLCDRIFIRIYPIFYAFNGVPFDPTTNPPSANAPIYSFTIGRPGNSCAPFALTNGDDFGACCTGTATG